jgi:hypothetical protein
MIEIKLTDLQNINRDLLEKTAKFLLDIANSSPQFIPMSDIDLSTIAPAPLVSPPVSRPIDAPMTPVEEAVSPPPSAAEKKKRSRKTAEVVAPTAAPALVVPPPPTADFTAFMTRVTDVIKNNILAHVDIINLVKEFGVDGVHSLSSRPELVPLVLDALNDLVNEKGNVNA